MNHDSSDTEQIFERLRQFSEAYAKRDIPAVLATFAHGATTPVVVAGDSALPLIGTSALCQRLVQEFSMQFEFRLRTRAVEFDINGDVAWVAVWSDALISGQHQTSPTRLTAILAKEPNGWFISQLHFSVPLSANCELLPPNILHAGRPRATFSAESISTGHSHKGKERNVEQAA